MSQDASPSLTEPVLERLRRDICSLVLAPDLRLHTQMLEDRYQTGLSVVREALCVLAGEGLVVREERKGFRVAAMSLADFDLLTDMRISVELSALDHAFNANHTNWQLEIDAALQSMGPNVKVGDRRRLGRDWERKHRHFHFSLVNAYRSPLTLDFYSRIYDRYDRYRSLALPRLAYLASVGQDHKSMADFVRSNSLTQARDMLARHVQDTSVTIRAGIVAQNLCNERGEVMSPEHLVVRTTG